MKQEIRNLSDWVVPIAQDKYAHVSPPVVEKACRLVARDLHIQSVLEDSADVLIRWRHVEDTIESILRGDA